MGEQEIMEIAAENGSVYIPVYHYWGLMSPDYGLNGSAVGKLIGDGLIERIPYSSNVFDCHMFVLTEMGRDIAKRCVRGFNDSDS